MVDTSVSSTSQVETMNFETNISDCVITFIHANVSLPYDIYVQYV